MASVYTSTYKSFLMKGTTSGSSTTWTKLVDITNYPAIFGNPNPITFTDLSTDHEMAVDGLRTYDSKTFGFNYKWDEFQELKEGERTSGQYAIWFGGTESNGVVTPTGSDGKFYWTGSYTIDIDSKGSNEVRTGTLTMFITDGPYIDTTSVT